MKIVSLFSVAGDSD